MEIQVAAVDVPNRFSAGVLKRALQFRKIVMSLRTESIGGWKTHPACIIEEHKSILFAFTQIMATHAFAKMSEFEEADRLQICHVLTDIAFRLV